MKVLTTASTAVIASTLGGSLLLSPVHHEAAVAIASPASLPVTGSRTPVLRIKHANDVESVPAPTEIYEQYVAPVPVVAAQATPPGGHVTIAVPIYRQTRALNCETGALQMGLAAYGHYFSQDSLFAYEKPDLRRALVGANGTVSQWGDPYTNFVGSVNGTESGLTEIGRASCRERV